jgi:hypothetical protein
MSWTRPRIHPCSFQAEPSIKALATDVVCRMIFPEHHICQLNSAYRLPVRAGTVIVICIEQIASGDLQIWSVDVSGTHGPYDGVVFVHVLPGGFLDRRWRAGLETSLGIAIPDYCILYNTRFFPGTPAIAFKSIAISTCQRICRYYSNL